MDVIIGLDTSCYTTSAAMVDLSGKIVAFSRKLLPVGSGERGLRQSEAVFAHVKQMPEVMDQLTESAPCGYQIVAVCASTRPRDDVDSYMPVFTAGHGYGRVLASALKVPFYETSHQQGHIAAGMIGQQEMRDQFIALHISGGTTDLLFQSQDGLCQIGGSLDLHAGQLVDRIGVRMGLSFPAGPALERLAMANQDATQALLAASMDKSDLCCHLSGGETKALQLIEEGKLSQERIAAEVFDLLARTVSRMLVAGAKEKNVHQALVVGGVASSEYLRKEIAGRLGKQRYPIDLRFGEKRYSADNAAGVARIGLKMYQG
ncbi:MAG: O-sialoglycoprotein endopeptidase [Eubacteriales bacterium]|nr:O-sialoglycoprotein endopeptidase [Eubacteriales bacterium]